MRRIFRFWAVPLALALLLALTALAHGILLLSRHEVQAAASLRDLARAQRGAEVGLHLLWSDPSLQPAVPGPKAWEPLGAGDLPGGLSFTVSRFRLDVEFFLLAGTGTVHGRGWGTRVVWLGRTGPCELRDEANRP